MSGPSILRFKYVTGASNPSLSLCRGRKLINLQVRNCGRVSNPRFKFVTGITPHVKVCGRSVKPQVKVYKWGIELQVNVCGRGIAFRLKFVVGASEPRLNFVAGASKPNLYMCAAWASKPRLKFVTGALKEKESHNFTLCKENLRTHILHQRTLLKAKQLSGYAYL